MTSNSYNYMRARILCMQLSLLFAGSLMMSPAPARADTLDNILDILVSGGVIDPAVKDAKPLIQCLVNTSNPAICVNLTQVAMDEGKQVVAKFMPDDPAIKATVQIIQAANKSDWIKVLELTGTDLLFQIACKAGLAAGGPLKNFICGDIFVKVSKLGKSIVRETLVAIKNQDWWKLVTIVGVDVACDIIPGDVPLKGEICGVVGKVFKEVGKYAKASGEAAWNAVTEVGEVLSGQTQHMHPDDYYAQYFQGWIHNRVLERLAYGRQGLGLDKSQWDKCVKYFDSHKQSASTANKTCTNLGNHLHQEANAIAHAMAAAPAAYYAAYLASQVGDIAAEEYWNDSIAKFKIFVDQLPPAKRTSSEFHYGPSKRLWMTYVECRNEMIKKFYVVPLPVKELAPPTAWDWVCYEAAGKQLAAALVQEHARLKNQVIPKMQTLGCKAEKAATGSSLVFACASYASYASCKQETAGYKYEHCKVDKITADIDMGKKLVAKLGVKRCNFLEKGTAKPDAPQYHDPTVMCTRPWKQTQCESLLAYELAKEPVVAQHPFAQHSVKCKYFENYEFKQAQQQAQTILAALNSGASQQAVVPMKTVDGKTVDVHTTLKTAQCYAQPDPLAIICPALHTPPKLDDKLPGVTLALCAPDPNLDGADAPCYAPALAAAGKQRGKPDMRAAPPATESGARGFAPATAIPATRGLPPPPTPTQGAPVSRQAPATMSPPAMPLPTVPARPAPVRQPAPPARSATSTPQPATAPSAVPAVPTPPPAGRTGTSAPARATNDRSATPATPAEPTAETETQSGRTVLPAR